MNALCIELGINTKNSFQFMILDFSGKTYNSTLPIEIVNALMCRDILQHSMVQNNSFT